MYQVKLFDEGFVTGELRRFLNDNRIPRENIVSISMGADSSILLVYWRD